MPFSFNPGQEQPIQQPQQSGQVAQQPALNNDGVPVLNVPVAPSITLTPVAEVVSPFAFRNRNKSKFSVYFQAGVFGIFAVTLVASVGLYIYQAILSVQLDSKKKELVKLEATFPKNMPIADMKKLSARIALINKTLNERASVRTALVILEESANNPVTYNKFDLSKNKRTNAYNLNFSGETNSYEALYQQIGVLKSDTFKQYLPKIEISGIGPLDKKGIASFKVAATVAILGIDPDEKGFTVIHKDGNVNTFSTSTDQASIVSSALGGNANSSTSTEIKTTP